MFNIKLRNFLPFASITTMLLFSITPLSAVASLTHTNENANSTDVMLWQSSFLNNQRSAPLAAEYISRSGAVSQISMPRMQIYLPEKSNHTAILVLSGGGYEREELGKEGTPVSKWLAAQGFTVFKMLYRLPNEGWKNKQVAFADAQRAMRLIRSKASQYDIQQVGVMGFSAGGHVAGLLAASYSQNFYHPQDAADSLSARPDFIVLLYPIISMLPPYNDTRSYQNLIGAHASLVEQKTYSVEQRISRYMPPTFIAHAKDDQIAPIDKSIAIDRRLHQIGVAHEIVVFNQGGHGWGLGKPGSPTVQWPKRFLSWYKQLADKKNTSIQ